MRLRTRRAITLLAAFLLFALFAVPSEQASALPDCQATPCVVTSDMGGVLKDYFDLVDRVLHTGITLQIAGDCYSACTILADQARPNVCLRPQAAMHIHQGFFFQGPNKGQPIPVVYGPDLMHWIDAHGGEPLKGWLTIDYQTALKFWPSCG